MAHKVSFGDLYDIKLKHKDIFEKIKCEDVESTFGDKFKNGCCDKRRMEDTLKIYYYSVLNNDEIGIISDYFLRRLMFYNIVTINNLVKSHNIVPEIHNIDLESIEYIVDGNLQDLINDGQLSRIELLDIIDNEIYPMLDVLDKYNIMSKIGYSDIYFVMSPSGTRQFKFIFDRDTYVTGNNKYKHYNFKGRSRCMFDLNNVRKKYNSDTFSLSAYILVDKLMIGANCPEQ